MNSIAFAISSESPAGTSKPVRPSCTISGIPPTFVATTERPAACASAKTIPKPSQMDDSTKKSHACKIYATSGRFPINITVSSKPFVLTKCFKEFRKNEKFKKGKRVNILERYELDRKEAYQTIEDAKVFIKAFWDKLDLWPDLKRLRESIEGNYIELD